MSGRGGGICGGDEDAGGSTRDFQRREAAWYAEERAVQRVG